MSLLQPPAVRPVLVASLLAVGGYVGMFLLAARAAGVHGPPQRLLPLALVVLLAAAIPLNVAGWGPREGAAAWVFAAAEWGAAAGAAVATAFGVLTLVAVLPGAVVLLAGRRQPPARPSGPPVPDREPVAVVVHGGTPRGRCGAWLIGPTPCSAAACRSTATWTARTPPGCCLSNAADFDRVDAERARCDAILVGAATVRADNPRLLVRSAARRAERVAAGPARRPRPRSR